MKRIMGALVLLLALVGANAFADSKVALTVKCNVGGSQVYLNGRLLGYTTPNFSQLLPAGNYELIVKAKGFPDYRTNVRLVSDPVVIQVNFGAAPAPAPQPQGQQEQAKPQPVPQPQEIAKPQNLNFGLSVQSNVNGADVIINGNPAGKTPFSAQVPNGSYTLVVRAPGFNDYSQNIVVNGGPLQINAMLQGQSQQLTVQSNVIGATVAINGNVAGKTPFAAQVPSGSYSIQVKAPGYVDFNQNVVVGNGPAQVNANLQSMSYQVNVGANVNGALVFINGSQSGQTPYASMLPPGTYTILVRASGYMDYQVQINVNGPQAINAVLQQMIATWQLKLPESFGKDSRGAARNRDIQVWVDGVQQADSQGMVGGQLLPGRHVIRLMIGGLVAEAQVDAQSGRAYSIEPELGLMVK